MNFCESFLYLPLAIKFLAEMYILKAKIRADVKHVFNLFLLKVFGN
jgi:hypothetical protein